MSLGTILLMLLFLLLLAVSPTWPHSKGWGYYPSGAFGVAIIVVIILVATGRL